MIGIVFTNFGDRDNVKLKFQDKKDILEYNLQTKSDSANFSDRSYVSIWKTYWYEGMRVIVNVGKETFVTDYVVTNTQINYPCISGNWAH